MKTRILTTLCACALLVYALPCRGQSVVLADDFESGLGNWTMDPVSPGLTVSTAQNHTPSGTQSAVTSTSSSAMVYNLGLEADGYFKLTFWLYDDAGTRTYGDVRSYSGTGFNDGSVQQVFAVGKYQIPFGTPTGIFASEVVDTSLYQGRILTGPDSGWFNLPGVTRTPNAWVKFDLERLNDGTVNFYVNDTLSRSVSSPIFYEVDSVLLGSVRAGATSTVGYFDDVVVTIPEPSTFAMIVVAGLALGAKTARRKLA